MVLSFTLWHETQNVRKIKNGTGLHSPALYMYGICREILFCSHVPIPVNFIPPPTTSIHPYIFLFRSSVAGKIKRHSQTQAHQLSNQFSCKLYPLSRCYHLHTCRWHFTSCYQDPYHKFTQWVMSIQFIFKFRQRILIKFAVRWYMLTDITYISF